MKSPNNRRGSVSRSEESVQWYGIQPYAYALVSNFFHRLSFSNAEIKP
jgi:hypothetical protein